jgi:simple sugar transport system substrate-binding protein
MAEMISKLFAKKRLTILKVIAITVILAMVLIACAPAATPTEAPEPEAPAEEPQPEEAMEGATLAIEHFSVIEGTTWSGAHDRAGKRIAEKFDNVDYVFREDVGPDVAVPFAEELISGGADIVVGNTRMSILEL